MMQKLAVPGYRVAPMYNDSPSGTIIGRDADGLHVYVAWDTRTQKFRYGIDHIKDAKNVRREQIKYLRKGNPLDPPKDHIRCLRCRGTGKTGLVTCSDCAGLGHHHDVNLAKSARLRARLKGKQNVD